VVGGVIEVARVVLGERGSVRINHGAGGVCTAVVGTAVRYRHDAGELGGGKDSERIVVAVDCLVSEDFRACEVARVPVVGSVTLVEAVVVR